MQEHLTVTLKEALPIVLAAFKLGQSVELIGPPGCGKTEWCRNTLAPALAKHHGVATDDLRLKYFELPTIEFVDVRGYTIPSKNPEGELVTKFTLPPMFPHGEDAEHPGLLVLDEYGQSDADMQKATATLMLEHRCGEFALPDNWSVICCSNREEDQSGTARRLRHVENRRCVLYIRPSLDGWTEWAERTGINPFAVVYAKQFPGNVFTDAVPTNPGAYSTPRSFVRAMQLLEGMSTSPYELRTDGLATAAVAGWVGQGVAAEIVSFLGVQPELPLWEDVVARPKKAKIPDDKHLAAQMTVAQMLGHRVDEESAESVLIYLSRLREELQVSTIRAAIAKSPALVENSEFDAWLDKNESLLMAANASIRS